MKVAFLSKSISRRAGGLLPVMQSLGQELQHQYNTDITAFGINDDITESDKPGWFPVKVNSSDSLGPNFFGYSPELYRALVALKPHLVHTHGLFYYTSVAAHNWGKKNNRQYLISPHGMLDAWALQNSRWKKKLARWFFEFRHLANARCIHALSSAEAQDIRAFGLKNPICLIPNGVSLPEHKAAQAIPLRINYLNGRKILLYLGRLHPKKGLKSLITAWASVRRNYGSSWTDWILVIAGWDQHGYEAELKSIVDDLGLKDSVVFLGPQFNEDKAACYQNADAFVLPSLSEGVPMVVLEAWSYNIPVLMTPQCGLPIGFISNAAIEIQTDVAGIVKGLLQLFDLDSYQLKVMGDNGRKLVERQFTWQYIAEEMKFVYDWILGGGTVPNSVILD